MSSMCFHGDLVNNRLKYDVPYTAEFDHLQLNVRSLFGHYPKVYGQTL